MRARAAAHSTVIWHDVECGAYAGDLPLWGELAAEARGEVLELGAGTGRVALALARAGHRVAAIDDDTRLVDELARRAAAEGLPVESLRADCRGFDLARSFALVIAPMQLVQLLGGAGGRAAMLSCVRRHLAPAARFAATVLATDAARPASVGEPPPLPDVHERDGWVYSSLPIEVAAAPGGFEVRRLRQRVSPEGELAEETNVTFLDHVPVERLEAEAAEAALRPVDRRAIPPTRDHVGSTAVVLEGS